MLKLFILDAPDIHNGWHVLRRVLPCSLEHLECVFYSILMLVD